jgi:ribulose-phosphate 3-epimerase
MKTHVGINAKNKKGFIAQLSRAKKFLPKGTWLHIDVSDPEFSKIKSYFNPALLKKYSGYFNFEAHLMVPYKKIFSKKYLAKPVKKIWIHVSQAQNWNAIKKAAAKRNIKAGIAIGIGEKNYLSKIPKPSGSILVLAVNPGPSGQKFGSKAVQLVDFLRKKYPHATISIDGGINPQIARKVKKAGADVIVSTSYIWNSRNPKEAYKKLSGI